MENMMSRLHLLFVFALCGPLGTVEGQSSETALKFDLRNPGMFAGSDFGNFLQRQYVNGQFTEMVKFTASGSRRMYGDSALKDYYRDLDFGFQLRLKSMSVMGDTITLNYQTSVNATQRIIRLPVIVEQDSVRVIVRGMNSHLFTGL